MSGTTTGRCSRGSWELEGIPHVTSDSPRPCTSGSLVSSLVSSRANKGSSFCALSSAACSTGRPVLKRRSAEARFVYRIVYVRSFNDLGRGYGGLPALAFKADLKLHVPQNAVDAGVCVTRLAVDRGLRVIRGLRAQLTVVHYRPVQGLFSVLPHDPNLHISQQLTHAPHVVLPRLALAIALVLQSAHFAWLYHGRRGSTRGCLCRDQSDVEGS